MYISFQLDPEDSVVMFAQPKGLGKIGQKWHNPRGLLSGLPFTTILTSP